MDTLETYIKMCDCPEIQYAEMDYAEYRLPRIRKGILDGKLKMFPHRGDWIVNVAMLGLSHHAIRVSQGEDTSPQLLWLPRQDQLQELSGLSWYLFDKTCVPWATVNTDYQSQSKEIVGVQVVMKEKFNKVWNGESWLVVDGD